MGFWGIFFIVVCACLFLAFIYAVGSGVKIGDFFTALAAAIVAFFVAGVTAVFAICASLIIPVAFIAIVLLLVKWIFF